MNDYKPYEPEKKIIAEISAKEAHLIKILRQTEYGTFSVIMQIIIIVRVECGVSNLLNEKDGLDIAIEEEN